MYISIFHSTTGMIELDFQFRAQPGLIRTTSTPMNSKCRCSMIFTPKCHLSIIFPWFSHGFLTPLGALGRAWLAMRPGWQSKALGFLCESLVALNQAPKAAKLAKETGAGGKSTNLGKIDGKIDR
jgi:hypothetical protein